VRPRDKASLTVRRDKRIKSTRITHERGCWEERQYPQESGRMPHLGIPTSKKKSELLHRRKFAGVCGGLPGNCQKSSGRPGKGETYPDLPRLAQWGKRKKRVGQIRKRYHTYLGVGSK